MMKVLEATMTWILAFLVKVVVVKELVYVTMAWILGEGEDIGDGDGGGDHGLGLAVVTMTCVPASLVLVMVVMELVEVTMTWFLGHPSPLFCAGMVSRVSSNLFLPHSAPMCLADGCKKQDDISGCPE